jgi:AcrR family transcriptional regulator
MPAPQDPIRAQLVEARCTQLLEAAATVFAEKGFHRATTREIASVAGVSEGTIYNYFDSKEGLLIGIMARLAELESLDEELMEALHGDVRDFFIAMFRHRMGRIQQGQEMLQAVLPEVMVNPELRAHRDAGGAIHAGASRVRAHPAGGCAVGSACRAGYVRRPAHPAYSGRRTAPGGVGGCAGCIGHTGFRWLAP